MALEEDLPLPLDLDLLVLFRVKDCLLMGMDQLCPLLLLKSSLNQPRWRV